VRRLVALYRGTVGKKAIVAVTGVLLLGFLLFHAAGNLKTFLPDPSPGVPDIDVYAAFLRSMGEPLVPHESVLWLVRCVLVAALVLHVVCVLQLAARNRRARPMGYARADYVRANASGRFMLYTGAVLLLFVVIHIPHLTTGSLDAARFVHGAVYANLHRAFGQWPFVAIYLVAMGVLGLHLYHGAWSAFQSLGLDSPDRNRGLRRMAVAVAVLLPLAFASVPAAFFAGAMEPPPSSRAHVGGGR